MVRTYQPKKRQRPRSTGSVSVCVPPTAARSWLAAARRASLGLTHQWVREWGFCRAGSFPTAPQHGEIEEAAGVEHRFIEFNHVFRRLHARARAR